MQRLYKDKHNRMLGGVCAGIAEYLGIDITLTRAVAVVSCLMFTPLISVYFLFMMILPDKSEVSSGTPSVFTELRESIKSGQTSSYIKPALLLIIAAVGLLVLTEAFFHVDIKIKYIIIFGLIIFGLYLITTKDLHADPSKRVITGAGVCVMMLLWLASSAGWVYFPIAVIISTFINIWPLLLAAFGLSLLLQNKKYVYTLWSIIAVCVAIITLINYISVII